MYNELHTDILFLSTDTVILPQILPGKLTSICGDMKSVITSTLTQFLWNTNPIILSSLQNIQRSQRNLLLKVVSKVDHIPLHVL